MFFMTVFQGQMNIKMSYQCRDVHCKDMPQGSKFQQPDSQCYDKWKRATAYPIYHSLAGYHFSATFVQFFFRRATRFWEGLNIKNLLALHPIKNIWWISRPEPGSWVMTVFKMGIPIRWKVVFILKHVAVSVFGSWVYENAVLPAQGCPL